MNKLIVCTDGVEDSTEDSRFQKPNMLIVLRPKFGKITVTPRRLLNVLIYLSQNKIAEECPASDSILAKRTGLSFMHPISEIVELVCPGNATGSHSIFRDAVTTLQMALVDSSSPDANKGSETSEDWSQFTLLAGAERRTINNRVYLEWSFAHQINQILNSPKKYTSMDIHQMALLTTYCSLALYEIALRYKDNPSNVTSSNDPEWWMHALSGNSRVDSFKQYKSKSIEFVDFTKSVSNAWSAFKRDHLNKAINLVYLVSSIQLELIETKAGKSIATVQFRVVNKVQLPSINQQDLIKGRDEILAIKEGVGVGLSRNDCIGYVKTYGIDAFLIGVKKIKSNLDSQNPTGIVSVKPYFKKLMSNTFTSISPSIATNMENTLDNENTESNKPTNKTASNNGLVAGVVSIFDKYKVIISSMSQAELDFYKVEIANSFRKSNLYTTKIKLSLEKEFFGGGVCLSTFRTIYDEKSSNDVTDVG